MYRRCPLYELNEIEIDKYYITWCKWMNIDRQEEEYSGVWDQEVIESSHSGFKIALDLKIC